MLGVWHRFEYMWSINFTRLSYVNLLFPNLIRIIYIYSLVLVARFSILFCLHYTQSQTLTHVSHGKTPTPLINDIQLRKKINRHFSLSLKLFSEQHKSFHIFFPTFIPFMHDVSSFWAFSLTRHHPPRCLSIQQRRHFLFRLFANVVRETCKRR